MTQKSDFEDLERMVNSLEKKKNSKDLERLAKRLLEMWKEEGNETQYDAQERREFARLVYPSGNRPKFQVREYEMEIVNISEKGIMFIKTEEINMGQSVYGTAKLLCGKSIGISGKIIWQIENKVGLLIKPILHSVIIEEIRTLIRKKD